MEHFGVNKLFWIRVGIDRFAVSCKRHFICDFRPHRRLPILYVYVFVCTIAVSLSLNKLCRIRVGWDRFGVSCKRHFIRDFPSSKAFSNLICICICMYYSCVFVFEQTLSDKGWMGSLWCELLEAFYP